MRRRWKVIIPIALVPLLAGAGFLAWRANEPVSSDDPGWWPGGGGSEKGRVTGTITDAEGLPIENALIDPNPTNHNDAALPEIGRLSKEDGTYGFDLPPGDYELTVHVEDAVSDPQEVTVEEGETITVDFEVAVVGGG